MPRHNIYGRCGVVCSGRGCHVRKPFLEAPRCPHIAYRRRKLALLSDAVAEQARVAHVGEVVVLTLLLNVDGVGMLARLLYVGDGGLVALVVHADDIGVLAWVWMLATLALPLLTVLLLHLALGDLQIMDLWEVHHLVPPSPPPPCAFFADSFHYHTTATTPTTTSRSCPSCSWGRTSGNPFIIVRVVTLIFSGCGKLSCLGHLVHAWLPRGPQQMMCSKDGREGPHTCSAS